MSRTQLAKNVVEALMYRYRDGKLPPKEHQILWQVMERVAQARVEKIFHWRDPELIGNAVSEGILNLPNFKGDTRVLGWYLKTIDNLCRNALTQRSQRSEIEIGQLPENTFTTEIDWGLLEDVGGILQEDEKELLKMKLEGYTEAEIAKALGQPAKGVHARLVALVRNLRRKLS